MVLLRLENYFFKYIYFVLKSCSYVNSRPFPPIKFLLIWLLNVEFFFCKKRQCFLCNKVYGSNHNHKKKNHSTVFFLTLPFRRTYRHFEENVWVKNVHCVKSVRIRTFSGPYFPSSLPVFPQMSVWSNISILSKRINKFKFKFKFFLKQHICPDIGADAF